MLGKVIQIIDCGLEYVYVVLGFTKEGVAVRAEKAPNLTSCMVMIHSQPPTRATRPTTNHAASILHLVHSVVLIYGDSVSELKVARLPLSVGKLELTGFTSLLCVLLIPFFTAGGAERAVTILPCWVWLVQG